MTSRHLRVAVLASVLATAVSPAGAGPQLGTLGKIGAAAVKARQLQDIKVSDEEEARIGAGVSERIRQRYGVVQDARVHRYVGLVGRMLTAKSTRPGLAWTFIVLDTDGVNAFAAPGGFVHVTRGALALMRSESELAGVLAHEVVHVTEKHTIRAIQKGKLVQMGVDETVGGSSVLLTQLVERSTELVLTGFGRGDELDSDAKGLALANAAGYAPQGLVTFLTTLQGRNRTSTAKAGLFASHPEMQERLARADTTIRATALSATVTLEDRYRASVPYKPSASGSAVPVESGAAGLTGGTPASKTAAPSGTQPAAADPPKKRGFGLGSLMKPGGSEKPSAQVTGSGAARGADTERDAKGGANPTLVAVTLSAAEIDAFRTAGRLKYGRPWPC